MQIGVLGLNHRTASLALREAFALATERLCSHALVLSTCNRSEIYFSDADGAEFQTRLLEELKTVLPVSFEQHLYTFFGRECFLHLAKVCSGLDSAILGECDIKRQVKRAYLDQSSVATKDMHFVFQKSFQIAKELKDRFDMSAWSYDLPHRVKDTLFSHGVKNVLFVGYSAINRRVISVCENTFDFAIATDADISRKVCGKDPDPTWLEYDAIVVARHGQVLRKDDPLPQIVIDLGVPRNVDPSVDRIVYNIDMLQDGMQSETVMHAKEISYASELLITLVNTKLTQFNRYKYHKRIPFLVAQ